MKDGLVSTLSKRFFCTIVKLLSDKKTLGNGLESFCPKSRETNLIAVKRCYTFWVKMIFTLGCKPNQTNLSMWFHEMTRTATWNPCKLFHMKLGANSQLPLLLWSVHTYKFNNKTEELQFATTF